MENQAFFMIKKGTISNTNNPAQLYTNYRDAEQEAIRLAQKQPGDPFFILKAICVIKTKEPEVTILDIE